MKVLTKNRVGAISFATGLILVGLLLAGVSAARGQSNERVIKAQKDCRIKWTETYRAKTKNENRVCQETARILRGAVESYTTFLHRGLTGVDVGRFPAEASDCDIAGNILALTAPEKAVNWGLIGVAKPSLGPWTIADTGSLAGQKSSQVLANFEKEVRWQIAYLLKQESVATQLTGQLKSQFERNCLKTSLGQQQIQSGHSQTASGLDSIISPGDQNLNLEEYVAHLIQDLSEVDAVELERAIKFYCANIEVAKELNQMQDLTPIELQVLSLLNRYCAPTTETVYDIDDFEQIFGKEDLVFNQNSTSQETNDRDYLLTTEDDGQSAKPLATAQGSSEVVANNLDDNRQEDVETDGFWEKVTKRWYLLLIGVVLIVLAWRFLILGKNLPRRKDDDQTTDENNSPNIGSD